MIISTSHRFIFVHIVKTAGTSVTEALARTVRWNDVVVGGTDYGEAIQAAYHRQFGLSKHATAREICDTIGAETWAGMFSFAFVRHPFARAVSVYTWKRKMLEKAASDDAVWQWPASRAFAATTDFSGFIRHPDFLASVAARPQADWVTGADGRRIVDFVGRVEAIEAGMREICGRIGIPYEGVPVANASAGPSAQAREPLAEDDSRHLTDLYRKDFVAFGYDPTERR
jgi:hypothetical protein